MSGLESGTELAGRYRLESLLERGADGEAWCCTDLRFNREVAVTMLLPAAVPDPDTERQFLRDAECAAGLRHPGIAAVFDAGQHDGRLFLVTEPLRGRDLASLLREHSGGLPVGQALSLGVEIAAALACAHGAGVVHRDLNPRSVLVAGDGSAKIRGFGIAREPGGSPAYLAPELWAGEPVTDGGDRYALGCVLYELLVGRPPFAGPSLAALMHRHLTEVPVPPRDLRPELPADLSDLVAALLAKAPRERPPDAAAVADALTQIRDLGRWSRPAGATGLAVSGLAGPGPARPVVACAGLAGPGATAGAIDMHAVDATGRIRRRSGAAGESGFRWDAWADLPPPTAGKVTALASGGNGGGGVYVTAAIDGTPYVNEGLAVWRELLGTRPLRRPVADIAVLSAPWRAVNGDGVTAYVLGDDGVIWSNRAATPLNTPPGDRNTVDRNTGDRFAAIAACAWSRTDPVLLAAAADTIQCRFWWAGTREFRWRPLPFDAGGRLVTDIACTSLAAKRIEVFVLCDDGSISHSSVRLAQEGTLDWSVWVRLPLPPGHVTALAACQFGLRDGAVIAGTSDGELHVAAHGIEVIRTGLSRCSPWSVVPL